MLYQITSINAVPITIQLFDRTIIVLCHPTMGSDDIEVPAQPLQLDLAGFSFEGRFLNNSLSQLFVMSHTTLLLSTPSINIDL